jgi:hypothetical protein
MTTKFRAAHKMASLNPQGKVTKADAGFTMMKNSGNFPDADWPIPPVSVQKAITDLSTAITAAANGVPGGVSNMHEKERVLMSVFNLMRSYVELTANNTADPKTIIESAGMVAYTTVNSGPLTDMKLTAEAGGTVTIEVPRMAGEVAFVYQLSSDAGVTWTTVESSKLAQLKVKGLSPGSILHFRFAAIGKVQGVFSQSKSVVVV